MSKNNYYYDDEIKWLTICHYTILCGCVSHDFKYFQHFCVGWSATSPLLVTLQTVETWMGYVCVALGSGGPKNL